jgi:hypothetical protein
MVSTFAAEAGACLECYGMAHYVRVFLAEALHGQRMRERGVSLCDVGEDLLPVMIVSDCRSLYDNMKVDGSVPEDRHSAVYVAALRCVLSAGAGRDKRRSRLRWTPSRWQLADVLTKAGLASGFREVLTTGRCLFTEPSAQSLRRAEAESSEPASIGTDGRDARSGEAAALRLSSGGALCNRSGSQC